MLGPGLVRKERTNNEEIIKPVSMLPNVIELAYYSNTLMTFFAMDSIIATALYSLNAINVGYVGQQELVDTCLDLCDIFQYEFIFCKPCQNLESIIWDCIEDLNTRQEIFVPVSKFLILILHNYIISSYFYLYLLLYLFLIYVFLLIAICRVSINTAE